MVACELVRLATQKDGCAFKGALTLTTRPGGEDGAASAAAAPPPPSPAKGAKSPAKGGGGGASAKVVETFELRPSAAAAAVPASGGGGAAQSKRARNEAWRAILRELVSVARLTDVAFGALLPIKPARRWRRYVSVFCAAPTRTHDTPPILTRPTRWL